MSLSIFFSSFGYRGEDGKVISEGKRPETFAVNFGLNDVVGCGIDYTKSVVFYTKNGIHLGSAGSIGSTRYFPAVSMSSPGESIQANFGTSPFHFDIPEYVSSVIEEEVAQISRMSVPVDAHELVASYLDFAGYSESAAALPTSYPSATLSFRSLLRALIMSGNVGKAISLIEDSFNEILCGYTFVFLYSQNVFELVLNRDTLNACCFMKQHLSKYRNDTATDIIELLAETCGLFCYDEPDLSGIQLRREKLWRHVNRIVLSPSQEWDPIEMLVREIVASKTLARTRGIVPSAKAVCAGPVRTRIHTEKCDKLV